MCHDTFQRHFTIIFIHYLLERSICEVLSNISSSDISKSMFSVQNCDKNNRPLQATAWMNELKANLSVSTEEHMKKKISSYQYAPFVRVNWYSYVHIVDSKAMGEFPFECIISISWAYKAYHPHVGCSGCWGWWRWNPYLLLIPIGERSVGWAHLGHPPLV